MLFEKKQKREPITMLTAYDYPLALLEDRAGIDIILVGDSLGMTVLGYDSTLPVTMDVMVVHAQAVRRGAKYAFVIGDMPYMSYQISPAEAVRNAGRFMAEAGCDGVKLEGGAAMAPAVKAIVSAGIPVMGHLGITPQSMSMLGGFRSQGRSAEAALRIVKDADALFEAGISMLLLEGVPPEVGKCISERLPIPVISIGAGPYCDGQLLIVHDALGFFDRFTPKFVKKYADLSAVISAALEQYKQEVATKQFPGPEHCYKMIPGEAQSFMEEVAKLEPVKDAGGKVS
ncbi:MAG TPA: 3-methyl-2-oxobutanoate hydroxymethyltransferase [Firmicutes bacterium]|nr:3-methyl-2-oxobutanoate hydroxymethyltransferase [Bacillota bacterium]